MKHGLIPLTEAVPEIFLQRRRHRRIPEPWMPPRIGPESIANVPLRSRNAITVALLCCFAVRRRRSINNHRSRMRAPRNQCNRQKHERQTQNLLHHDFPFVLRGLKSPGKGIRHRPLCCPPWGTDRAGHGCSFFVAQSRNLPSASRPERRVERLACAHRSEPAFPDLFF